MRWMLLTVPALGVTPVQKVVQMLSEMVATGKQEKHEEEVLFSTFSQWCDDTSVARTQAIKEGTRTIERLTADIQKADSDARVLETEIAELDGNLDNLAASKKEATDTRAKERADFQALHTDYSESIDAVQRAVLVLKRQNFDREQTSLIQKSLGGVAALAGVPAEAKRVITSFLNQPENDFLSRSAPKANAYEFQSGGVIGMLQKLLQKFTEEKRTAEKQEANSRHSFEMIAQDLTDQTDAAAKERNAKATLRAKRLQVAAQARGDKAETTQAHDADKKYLSEIRAECRQKSADYDNRQKLRAEELEALSKAIEILSSSAVAGHASTYLPAFAQKKISFLQMSMRTDSPLAAKAASFLDERAGKSGSRLLSLVASKVAEDPLKKVKQLIEELVLRLQNEANEEAEHKGWCDTELSTNKQTRDQKNEEVSTLEAHTDNLRSKIAKLAEHIATLSADISEINTAVAAATTQRSEEKTNNAQTVKDAVEGQHAVAQAITVLREFYSNAAAATSFSQKGAADDAPPTFDKPYTGQQSSSGGVVGMIEVIQSDFARLESDTAAAEQDAARAYKAFSQESRVTKATKEAENEHSEREKQARQTELNAAKKDLQGSQAELDAALEYYDKLKPSCVDAGVSYEERVARREEEIQSLKEALQILSGELA
eukprot:GEMP01023681.1.p1 GENE.GEMP01023681.1~~GEMP01023681.1.p1  ORF type:complete len:661 (+),score=251.96 GEMP01023681.1:39-2021(+)